MLQYITGQDVSCYSTYRATMFRVTVHTGQDVSNKHVLLYSLPTRFIVKRNFHIFLDVVAPLVSV